MKIASRTQTNLYQSSRVASQAKVTTKPEQQASGDQFVKSQGESPVKTTGVPNIGGALVGAGIGFGLGGMIGAGIGFSKGGVAGFLAGTRQGVTGAMIGGVTGLVLSGIILARGASQE